jgi:hypothetical protein
MLRIWDEHTDMIGKIAKLTERGVLLEKEYVDLFGIGNEIFAKLLHQYCYEGGKYEISFMFIDEPPFKKNGVTWFCLKEVGMGVSGDWYWFTLNQLMICQ